MISNIIYVPFILIICLCCFEACLFASNDGVIIVSWSECGYRFIISFLALIYLLSFRFQKFFFSQIVLQKTHIHSSMVNLWRGIQWFVNYWPQSAIKKIRKHWSTDDFENDAIKHYTVINLLANVFALLWFQCGKC